MQWCMHLHVVYFFTFRDIIYLSNLQLKLKAAFATILSTTFLNNYGGDGGLRNATWLKTVVGCSNGMFLVLTFAA